MKSRILKTIAILILILTFVQGFTSTVFAIDNPELKEYLNTGGDGDSNPVNGANATAMQFTTGNMSHTVTHIRLSVKKVGDPEYALIAIQETEGGEPTGLDIVSATYLGDYLSTSYDWIEVEVDETALEGLTEYAIVLRAYGNSSNYVMWEADSGGGLADAVGYSSTNGGVTWNSDTPADYLFELWGYEAAEINGCGVFSGYVEEDDLIFIVDYTCEYAPYYPAEEPANRFDIQLRDADNNSIILASTPMVMWGRRPGAIYLSADGASGITTGDNCVIRIVSVDNPEAVAANYELEGEDWYGDNMWALDRWIIRLATLFEIYDTAVYVTDIAGVGSVLNESGGIIMDTGINGLSYTRPDIFQTTVNNPQYEIPVWTDAYMEDTDWEEQLGATVVADMESVGEPLDISGRYVIAGIVIGGVILLSLTTHSFTLGLISGYPALIMLSWLRVVDVAVLAIALFILSLVFVWKVWWSKT